MYEANASTSKTSFYEMLEVKVMYIKGFCPREADALLFRLS
jgi:hypothetical protein